MNRAFAALLVSLLGLPALGMAQNTANRVISSEIAISSDRAEIQMELSNGRKVTAATVVGDVGLERERTRSGDYMLSLGVERGSATDRAWRDLLNRGMEITPEELTTLLRGWEAPDGGRGRDFAETLRSALAGTEAAATVAPVAPVAPGVIDDSVVKLESRIQELQEELDRAHERREEVREERSGPDWAAPFRRIWQGISGMFGVIITYLVMFGIGFVAILFGARKYLEGVADTVRTGVGRSFLVGLAGSFLLIPVFVLGIIALAISIVGIPALLVWVPLFPVGAVCAVVLGFLGVAHAAGESWAERNYYGSDWFRRGNSYYFLMTGLILLGSLFFVAQFVHMAGPWLDFVKGILLFFGVLLTWASATVGFGAVLISRGGSRPANAVADQTSLFTEDANV